jgi:hypothetical protein
MTGADIDRDAIRELTIGDNTLWSEPSGFIE